MNAAVRHAIRSKDIAPGLHRLTSSRKEDDNNRANECDNFGDAADNSPHVEKVVIYNAVPDG